MASELILVPDDFDVDVTIRGLEVNQQVFGRYTLRHVLGRGGMGVVWLVYDERLERQVALKFLPEAVNFDPSALDDLKRETRRCLDLTHPNIIRIYDFVRDQQAAAISMEFIDGKTMAALRVEKERRVFEPADIGPWMTQACQALHYAHEEVKLVHRDLKPANLMLTSRGQIKIADFGIARSMGDSMSHVTMRRGTSGTLAYMSPQQMVGEMAQVTDDIYALGATIYEFLTSKPPFYTGDIPFQARTSIPKTMAQRRQELGISGEEIPAAWEETIAACLAKAPAERPQTMLDLAERLGLISGSRAPALETPPTIEIPVDPTGRSASPPPLPPKNFPSKRTRQIAEVAGGLMLILGPAAYLLLWPFLVAPGALAIATNPPGALVHISGQPDRTTPALLPSLRIGRYQVVISREGFDPVARTITISSKVKTDLGVIELKRALGQLDLVTRPLHAHYVLVGAESTGPFQEEGSTPQAPSTLPSGTFQLTLSEPGFPTSTETIEIPAHGTLVEKVDLIQEWVAAGAEPAVANVLQGRANPTQLDEAGRNELVGLLNNSFEEHLSYGFLAAAADELSQLKNLGKDVSAREVQLADKRTSTETDLSAELTRLIGDQKFATAREKLKNAEDVLEKESVDRLNARFQPTLAPYQQQVDAALQANAGHAPASAPLKALADQFPDDLSLQLALAETQTRMAPDHDRLTEQLRVFRQFAARNKDFAGDRNFLIMQAAFADELKQLDTLANALSAAKSGSSRAADQLARLKSEKATLEDRRVGHAPTNPFAQAVNFFGKVMVGHSVVNSQAYFSSQEQKEDAISDVQVRIDALQKTLSLPPETQEEAQKAYDDFLARVPWGPGATPPPNVLTTGS